jgi:hypothetical protein
MSASICFKPTEKLCGGGAVGVTGAGLTAMEGVGDLADGSWDEEAGVGFGERDEDEAVSLAPFSTEGMGISDAGIP